MRPVEPLKTDKQTNKQTNKQTDRGEIYFSKIEDFAARRAGTLRNRWNCNFKNRDDNVMRAADDKIRADDDLMRISKLQN